MQRKLLNLQSLFTYVLSAIVAILSGEDRRGGISPCPHFQSLKSQLEVLSGHKLWLQSSTQFLTVFQSSASFCGAAVSVSPYVCTSVFLCTGRSF